MTREPPDYRPDYRGDYSTRLSLARCSHLFTRPATDVNGTIPDYSSHHHRCSHPVVTRNALISNDFTPSDYLTTLKISKRKKEEKGARLKVYVRARGQRSRSPT